MRTGLGRIGFLALLAGASAACGASGDRVATGSQDQTESATLPLLEVSGLAVRDHGFVAIGDRSSTVVTFRLEDGELADVVKHEPLPKAGGEGSQYEAVTFDGAGHIVVLAETGDIAILSADAEKELGASRLDWLTVNPLIDSRVEANSGGEGIVILSADHVLVALEKNPSALVELGPRGDLPLGFDPERPRDATFAPPAELVGLAVWNVDDKGAPDLSELTVGPDGALWALSQQGKTIVRFERMLHPDEKRASVREHFDLPDELEGAEGLAFDGDVPVVGRDRSAKKKNVVLLDPLGD